MRTTAPPVVPFHFSSFESRAARSHHSACWPGGPPPPAAPPRRSKPSRSSASRPSHDEPPHLQGPRRRLSGESAHSPGGLQLSSLFGSVIAPLAVQRRSTRRGTPRPCRSVMPGACISRVPPRLVLPTGSGATARVRRPTLTTLPSSSHPRSQFTLPTAPKDRSRPHNLRLQRTVTRLLIGAAAPASARQPLNR